LQDAFHDALTALPNRALFLDRVEHALQSARRAGNSAFVVVSLDLNRFKVVNDSLGQTLGDQLLVATSHRLKGCLRLRDTVARLGSDEFSALLTGIDGPEDAVRIAERIKNELMEPFRANSQEIFVTASIGVAISRPEYSRSDDLLSEADAAMYRAKSQGRARYEILEQKNARARQPSLGTGVTS
jgi:diguanylate cyclase (GGDEF)-like protein